MENEQSELEMQGIDAAPVVEATPPTIPHDGELADDGAAAPQKPGQSEGSEPDDSEGDGEDNKAKDPTVKMQRRIDKLTARNKGYEEQIGQLRTQLEALQGEREAKDLEALRSLSVPPEALSVAERKEAKSLRERIDDVETQRAAWERYAEDGVTIQGREYSPAQCARFARQLERDAGRLEGRLELLVDRGRERLATLLKKHGSELFGESAAAAPPRIPAAKTAAATTERKASAAERAPGSSRAPSAVEGAVGSKAGAAAKLAAMSQSDLEAELSGF